MDELNLGRFLYSAQCCLENETKMKLLSIRFSIVCLLLLVTSVFYGGRSILSLSGYVVSDELHMSTVQLGYLFSAFSFSYVIFQVPCGLVLDRFDTKRLYLLFVVGWSMVMIMTYLVSFMDNFWFVFLGMLALRFLAGMFEAPVFPANSRIASQWFPRNEMSTASAIFGSSQYLAVVIFSPIVGLITYHWGWEYVFLFAGTIVLLFALFVFFWLQPLEKHSFVSDEERALILRDKKVNSAVLTNQLSVTDSLKILMTQRSMLGLCFGQYCMNAITFFFITWFPLYLMEAKNLSLIHTGLLVSIPALCGFLGNLIAGYTSDLLLSLGNSRSYSRKLPIIIGMALSTVMVITPLFESEIAIVSVMSIAFFGKGLSSLGWTIVSDIAPRSLFSLCGSIFNTSGNLSGMITPVAIAYIYDATGGFSWALIYIALHALMAIGCFTFVVGDLNPISIPVIIEDA